MNRSERLLSAFSEDYFFKELVLDDLWFYPKESTKIELADLIINLEDIIIAIQLKERNVSEQSYNDVIENKWLEKKCKEAKKQVKRTMQMITSSALPKFQNKRGQCISLHSDSLIIPIVIFDNPQIKKYPHLLRKHSSEGMDINCMSFEDYREMCRTLISPIEIISYLDYRKRLYEENGEIDIMISDIANDEMIISRPTQCESLVLNFLFQTYGKETINKQIPILHCFRSFLHELPQHTENVYDKEIYKVLIFLAHMNRREIVAFWEHLISTMEFNKKEKKGIIHSLRRGDNEFAIIFVSGVILPISKILPLVFLKGEVKRILEVAVYYVSEEEFVIDFLYWANICG